jgi:hypothetical protein
MTNTDHRVRRRAPLPRRSVFAKAGLSLSALLPAFRAGNAAGGYPAKHRVALPQSGIRPCAASRLPVRVRTQTGGARYASSGALPAGR